MLLVHHYKHVKFLQEYVVHYSSPLLFDYPTRWIIRPMSAVATLDDYCFIVRAVITQSVWRWATGWTIEVLGFDSGGGGGLEIFNLTTASRTALEPIQPPI
jgi:hypothetical protein